MLWMKRHKETSPIIIIIWNNREEYFGGDFFFRGAYDCGDYTLARLWNFFVGTKKEKKNTKYC